MESPEANAVNIPPPSQLSLYFARLFKRKSEFRRIFKKQKRAKQEKPEQVDEALDQVISTLPEAIERILNNHTISNGLGTDLEEFKRIYHAFRVYIPALRALGLTRDEWIGEHTKYIVVSMVFLLSTTVIHIICLLHPMWLSVGVRRVRHTHVALNHAISEILQIRIPWENSTFGVGDAWEIERSTSQLEQCDLAIGTGCLDDLPKLVSVMENTKGWESLTWKSRYDILLRARFGDLGRLLKKAECICNRSKWAGLMLPLPSQLSAKMAALSTLSSRADFHIQWIKPEVMLRVTEKVANFNTDLSLGNAAPALRAPWTSDEPWLMTSEQYKCWYNSAKGTTQRFLWCLGSLGMGKSVLMDTIVKHHAIDWDTHPKWLRPISVKIHFKSHMLLNDTAMTRVIVKQMLAQIKSPTNLVASIYESLIQGSGVYEGQDMAFVVLRDLTEAYTTYFFLDGLEEFEPSDMDIFIRRLVSLGPTTRVICFSRPTSYISQDVYPEFTFMDIQLQKTDVERYLVMLSDRWGASPANPFSSPDKRPAAIDTMIANMEGMFLLLAAQANEALSSGNGEDFFNHLDKVPDSVFRRFKSTMLRISRFADSKDIKNLISWVAVKKPLSISKDIPHLQSQFTASDMSAINRHALDSLGILRVVDGDSVTFTSHIAETYVSIYFPDLFPTFVSDVRDAFSSGAIENAAEEIRSSFTRFESFLATQSCTPMDSDRWVKQAVARRAGLQNRSIVEQE